VTNTSDQQQIFASRPLAEYQAEAARETTSLNGVNAAPITQAQPMPVLDIHFDDLPDEEYAEFNFPLRTTPGVIYTLGVEDDAVLFQIMDVAQDGSPNDIISYFFKSTFRRAVDENGAEIDNGLRYFQNAISTGKPGQRESRRYLMSVVTTAIEHWTEELTDTSMRPMNRAQRRARRR
jgi:hypothetical protein